MSSKSQSLLTLLVLAALTFLSVRPIATAAFGVEPDPRHAVLVEFGDHCRFVSDCQSVAATVADYLAPARALLLYAIATLMLLLALPRLRPQGWTQPVLDPPPIV